MRSGPQACAAERVSRPAVGTRVGEIELQIPKLRTGSYLPSFL
jgi:transposase-like protein